MTDEKPIATQAKNGAFLTYCYICLSDKTRPPTQASTINKGRALCLKHSGVIEKDESNLVTHARNELIMIDEDADTIDKYVRVVQAFADMGHSGGGAPHALQTIVKLLEFKSLSVLTDDPLEREFHNEAKWGDVGGIWQSRRDGRAFSKDGGKTYYLIDGLEKAITYNTKRVHTQD